MKFYYDIFESPFGKHYIVFTSEGIVRLDLTKNKFEERGPICQKMIHNEVRKQLHEYFIGKRKKFTISICLNGTAFQKKVWRAANNIPYGFTQSYHWVAKEISKPNANRAVGNALGANPIPIIIPCHRVIKKNGELGGFGGGCDLKNHLLNHERRYM